MNKFDIAFTHRYGEHLTFPLFMWSEDHWASAQGLSDVAHDSAEQIGTGDILEAGVTLLLLSALLSPLLVISAIFASPPWQSSALGPASIPTAAHLWTSSLPPSQWLPCPVETQHPVNEMMKSYFLFLSTEEKWIISSSWFPFTIQHHSRAKWVCLYSSITWWTMKNLHSYTAGLEEINQKRLKKGHSDWPLVTNFDFIHHFTTGRP